MKEVGLTEGFLEDTPPPGKKKKWPFIITICVSAVVLFMGGFLTRGWIDSPASNAPTVNPPPQQADARFSPIATGEPEGNRLIKVGFAQSDLIESDRRKANTVSIQDALSTANGYELIVADGQNDYDKQLQDVAGFIQKGADYIVIAPVQETGWDAVLQQANDASIPVIFVDRAVKASEDTYVTWIGSDFKDQGVKAMEWLKAFKGSKPVKAVHLQGMQGSSALAGRSAAYTEACVGNGWENLGETPVNGDITQAKEIMADWLGQFPDLNVVCVDDNDMTNGVVQAIEDIGMKAGDDDGITIISFNAGRRSLQLAFDTGKINCSVECNPLQGSYVADVIQKLESGETVEKAIYVEDAVFDWKDLTQAIIDARAY
ncbi:MAG: substrate-binding domain-containing protein [Oscillospiraceae bacterium]|nr:substrate-binding domain-containing protein [Oscillospiraceae bacterium]